MERITLTQPRQWHVLFQPKNKRFWWSRFLNDQFAHVHAATQIGTITLHINPAIGCTAINTYNVTIEEFLASYRDCIILKGYNNVMAKQKPIYNAYCCTQVIGAIFGVKALRPQFLYQKLLKKGFENG